MELWIGLSRGVGVLRETFDELLLLSEKGMGDVCELLV